MVARRQALKKVEPSKAPRLSPAARSEIEWVVGGNGGKIAKLKPGQRLGGREKGKPNRITTVLKEAIMEGIADIGYDGHGLDGVRGWVRRLAVREPAVAAALLGKVLPLQIISKNTETKEYVIRTSKELQRELKERGLPVSRMFEPTKALIPQSRGAPLVIEHEDNQSPD